MNVWALTRFWLQVPYVFQIKNFKIIVSQISDNIAD